MEELLGDGGVKVELRGLLLVLDRSLQGHRLGLILGDHQGRLVLLCSLFRKACRFLGSEYLTVAFESAH